MGFHSRQLLAQPAAVRSHLPLHVPQWSPQCAARPDSEKCSGGESQEEAETHEQFFIVEDFWRAFSGEQIFIFLPLSSSRCPEISLLNESGLCCCEGVPSVRKHIWLWSNLGMRQRRKRVLRAWLYWWCTHRLLPWCHPEVLSGVSHTHPFCSSYSLHVALTDNVGNPLRQTVRMDYPFASAEGRLHLFHFYPHHLT